MFLLEDSDITHSSKIYCEHTHTHTHKSPGSAFGKKPQDKNMEHLLPNIRKIHRKRLMSTREKEK